MLDAAYQLGKFLAKEEGIDIRLTITETPNVTHIIILELNYSGDAIVSHNIQIHEYDEGKHKTDFPFKKPPSSGVGAVPNVRINLSKIESTLRKKVIGWFKSNSQTETELSDIFTKTNLYLTNNLNNIVSEFSEKIDEIKEKKPSFVIGVRYSDPNIQKKLKEFYTEFILKEVYKKMYDKYSSQSYGTGICYYCGEEKEVYGFASPYTFYTHDKITFAGDFEISNAWKQFPVCGECELFVEYGVRRIEKNLSFKFYGLQYYLFPKFIKNDDIRYFIDYLKDTHMDEEKSLKKGATEVSINKKTLSNDEKEILADLSENDNNIMLTFLFYKKNNSQFEIISIINNILPSRLSELFMRKEELEQIELFKEWYDYYNKKNNFTFNYRYIRELFPSSEIGEYSRSDTYMSKFIEVIKANFEKNIILSDYIIYQATRMIQNIFSNRNNNETTNYEYKLYFYPFQYLMVYEYLNKTGCILTQRRTEKMTLLEDLNISNSKLAKKIIELFNTAAYFDDPIKKGTFIVGVLIRQVARKQHSRLGSTPIYEQIGGMRLNKRLINRIFPDAIQKLIEYSANKYEVSALETLAAHYFMHGNWTLSNEDLSFSFALGLSYEPSLWSGFKTNEEEE